MKSASFFLYAIIGLLHIIPLAAQPAHNHGVYYDELEKLKNAPETKLLFNEDAHPVLAEIQRDLIMCKNLTSFQRFVRCAFLALDVVVVTPETLPQLYEYIDSICKKAVIATPTIFISRKSSFLNAFAEKLLMSTGGIVIGQKLINELSDQAIEAVIAHEIGHIKYNHSNKHLALRALTLITGAIVWLKLGIKQGIMESDTDAQKEMKVLIYWVKLGAFVNVFSYLPSLIINKRFEKEADEFAYKANGKGAGIIEFFELILKKDELREEEFVSIYALLQKNKNNISISDYYSLIMSYYLARAGQLYWNLYNEIYHETFVGAHPSPQARIEAAKKHIRQQRN